jgi:hypothetical protein
MEFHSSFDFEGVPNFKKETAFLYSHFFNIPNFNFKVEFFAKFYVYDDNGNFFFIYFKLLL